MTSQVTREKIDLNGLLARAKNAAAGAVLLFSGDVRDHSENRAVDFLEYETHESMAQKHACRKRVLLNRASRFV